MTPAHTPVLPEEVMTLLEPPDGPALVVDATLGEGGHAEAFLARHKEIRLVGVEADSEIAARAARRLEPFGSRFRLWQGWFTEFFADYGSIGEGRPNRVLFDLGISTYHYTQSGRGFSFSREEPLDMRLVPQAGPSAADLVNGMTETELADLFYHLGEERFSRRIARRIVEQRGKAPVESSAELADLIRGAVPPQARRGRIHPATRCFQALRIAVNGELDRLSEVLPSCLDILAPGGRVGVIAFHSLEDRIVKRFFRQQADAGAVRLLTKKPVMVSEEEARKNPAARSTRFRVAEKPV
jgi:16S rRNA (cytosine1402-N4)-methyltransferase